MNEDNFEITVLMISLFILLMILWYIYLWCKTDYIGLEHIIISDKDKIYHNKKNITKDVVNSYIHNDIPYKLLLYNDRIEDNYIDHDEDIKNKKNFLKDLEVLKNKDYLKNYYYDIYGNRIKSSLKDYYADVMTNYGRDNPDVGVEIMKSKGNMILPDGYNIFKYHTDLYNIDWNRIINPMTVY